jgi:hypothetical protein
VNSRTQVESVALDGVTVAQPDDGIAPSSQQSDNLEIRFPGNRAPALQKLVRIMTAVSGKVGTFIGIHIPRFAQGDNNVDPYGRKKRLAA